MPDPSVLEVFDNPHPSRDYLVEHVAAEFTSLCPRTGQPDFGVIRVSYVPDKRCVELRSLKLYLQQYRQQGIFYEDVTNVILDHLLARCSPRWMRVRSEWSTRGGIRSVITCEHGQRPSQAPSD